jgi:DNA-binding transcriptional MocR family regulator
MTFTPRQALMILAAVDALARHMRRWTPAMRRRYERAVAALNRALTRAETEAADVRARTPHAKGKRA